MANFLDSDFLLYNKTARILYENYAKSLPVFDYHSHLPVDEIAENKNFENLTQIWLKGDHYKWRAMRANGVDESFITGNKSDKEKFLKWATTVPYTLRNPLFHWTHLELKRYFQTDQLLNTDTAHEIYKHCNELLQTNSYSVRNLLRRMNVEVVCTTDDPVDSLEHHQLLIKEKFEVKVLPTFRPDRALNIGDPHNFKGYVEKLGAICNKDIKDYNGYLEALKQRHDFFGEVGCRISDHGLEYMYVQNYTDYEVGAIFLKALAGSRVNEEEEAKFKAALLHHFAVWNFEKGWVQQFHLGALRNNSSRLLQVAGKDSGADSIGDYRQAEALSAFLNRLDKDGMLTKTILYNLNPADNDVFATMAGNFNDGSVPGKVQYGAAWWFLDQKDGIVNQFNTLSNMGLISRFVGMLTDSRSFLSFPRHEYFRRIICNLFGEEIEKGELPSDIEWTGKIIEDICYHNAQNYFELCTQNH